jgi:hypothetical protein
MSASLYLPMQTWRALVAPAMAPAGSSRGPSMGVRQREAEFNRLGGAQGLTIARRYLEHRLVSKGREHSNTRLGRARSGWRPLTEVARSELLFQRHLAGVLKDSAVGFDERKGGRWLRWWLMFFAGRTGMHSSGPWVLQVASRRSRGGWMMGSRLKARPAIRGMRFVRAGGALNAVSLVEGDV